MNARVYHHLNFNLMIIIYYHSLIPPIFLVFSYLYVSLPSFIPIDTTQYYTIHHTTITITITASE